MKQILIDVSKTDWKLLREQKINLLRLIEIDEFPNLRVGFKESLQGVVSWIDDIQDQAAEQIGEKKVFGRLK
jgi:hypothetical protein